MASPPPDNPDASVVTPTPANPVVPDVPAPSADKLSDYQIKDLRLKKFSLVVSICGFVVSIFGFAAVSIALFLNWNQSKLAVHQSMLAAHQSSLAEGNLRNSVQQSMTRLVFDLDRIFVEHEGLKAKLRDESLDPEDSKNWRELATAIMLLDVLDIAASQATTFKNQWDTPEAWSEWIVDEFAEQPFLRKVFQHRSKWYGKNLMNYFAEAKKKIPTKAGQTKK